MSWKIDDGIGIIDQKTNLLFVTAAAEATLNK
jgi:hypothetical protein